VSSAFLLGVSVMSIAGVVIDRAQYVCGLSGWKCCDMASTSASPQASTIALKEMTNGYG